MYTHQGAGPISETLTSVRSVFMSCPEKAVHFYFVSNLTAKNTAFKKHSKGYGLTAEKQRIIKKERKNPVLTILNLSFKQSKR